MTIKPLIVIFMLASCGHTEPTPLDRACAGHGGTETIKHTFMKNIVVYCNDGSEIYLED